MAGLLAGVATAIALGGPGATFWMILAGFLGMSSKFTECTLGVKYRDELPDGTVSGGPMYYLTKGLAEKGANFAKLGKVLAVLFAIHQYLKRTAGPARWADSQRSYHLQRIRHHLLGAAAEPEHRFLGLEVAGEYYRLVRRRMVRRRIRNLVLVRGEALYLLSAVLSSGFASAVHVYFPDPWPKARHHARRLFDSETVDLVIGE
mgnify:CR=1 FL=1